MKRKPCRPSGTGIYPVLLSVRISEGMLEKLEKIAARFNVTVSTVARWALSGKAVSK